MTDHLHEWCTSIEIPCRVYHIDASDLYVGYVKINDEWVEVVNEENITRDEAEMRVQNALNERIGYVIVDSKEYTGLQLDPDPPSFSTEVVEIDDEERLDFGERVLKKVVKELSDEKTSGAPTTEEVATSLDTRVDVTGERLEQLRRKGEIYKPEDGGWDVLSNAF